MWDPTQIASVPLVGVFDPAFVRDSGGNLVSGAAFQQIDDISGNGRHGVQTTGTLQWTQVAEDALFDGNPSIVSADSSDRIPITNWDPPAPGVTPTWIWFVGYLASWVNNRRPFFSGQTGRIAILLTGASPQMVLFNGGATSANSGFALSTVTRAIAYSASGASYLRCGSTLVTGDAGAEDQSSFYIGTYTDGQGLAGTRLGYMVITAGEPSAGERTLLANWGAAKFPSMVAG